MWFTETPWPPIVACTIAAAIFLGLWMTQGRGVHLAAVLGILAVAGGIYFVEKSVVTETERVEAAVLELADAVERDNVDDALGKISANATAERALVTTGLRLIDVDGNLRISDMQVNLLGENSRAQTHFRANGNIRYEGQSQHTPTRWLLTWQREAGDWKVIRIERLSPTGGSPLDPMAQRIE